ncbi:MAG: putative tail sheath [Podoviridae sp. ctbj_2]|nr:MAG: putative tail sheath [Podoviridae sp. ctbj_2]
MELDSEQNVQAFAIDPQYDLTPVDFMGTEVGEGSVRTQAATLALLDGDATGAAQTFDSIASTRGDERRRLIEQRTGIIQQNFKSWTEEGLMDVLADQSISLDQKQMAVDSIRNGATETTETADILASQALAAPVSGESEYAEGVRLNSADWLRASSQAYSERQAIMNTVKAFRDGDALDMAANLAESLTPAATGVALAGVETELGSSSGRSLMALLAPGSSIATLRDKLLTLPPEQQKAYFIQLKNAVLDKSGVITKDNQLRAAELIEKIGGDEYSDGQKYVDNIFQILDVVGIGAAIRAARNARSAYYGTKTMGEAAQTAEAYQTAQAPARAIDRPDLATPMPAPKVPANTADLTAAEKAYEDAIQQASYKLDDGAVSSLNQEKKMIQEALNEKTSVRDATMANSELVRKDNLRAQIDRIDSQLAAHKNAVKAEAQLAPMEKRLAEIKKRVEMQPAEFNPIMDGIRRAQMQSTAIDINPRSPGTIMYNNNPEMAANLRHMVFASQGDEVAQAVFGVTRDEALMQGIIPQVTTESGRIKAAPHNVERSTRELIASQMDDLKHGTGGLEFTPKELASARANIVRDFSEAVGIKLQPGMSSFRHDGERTIISGVYTNGESGWKLPEDAVAQAEFALRDRGITKDKITVMRRDADEYVPVKYDEVAGKPGDYVVRVDDEQIAGIADVGEWENLDVKRNLLDRLFGGNAQQSHGSFNRHVFDPASTLHTTITGSASVADDRTSIMAESLLKLASEFTDKYAKLPKARQAAMYDYIKEANIKEIPFDPVNVRARGFSNNEIDMLASWRDTWDAVYNLENLDLVRTLRGQKYQWFDNPNFTGVVRPIQKNMNKNQVYDPGTDKFITLSKADMDDLYNTGGTLAELRRPVVINGNTVENMLVRNRPGEFARAINDTDKILNKKDGYYQISYRSPKFIDETYVDQLGVERTHAVGVAGTTKDAQEAIKLMQTRNPNNRYAFRGDERGMRRDGDAYWDLNSVGGRIAQRHRGKLLEDSVGTQLFGAGDFIDSPTDSAVKAIMSISGRTSMRPVLEAAKERFIKQYGHLLTPDENRMYRFPTNRSDIKKKGEMTTKDLADARTTFEYIQYLENGYINALDDTIKNALRMFADVSGNMGFSKTERGLQSLSEISLTGTTKGAVFASMIASNPLRQWIVQSNQIVRTMAYNPRAWLSGDMGEYMNALVAREMGKKLTGDAKEFVDFVHDTGMFQAVTKNNLIRGTLLDLSDRQTAVGKVFNKPVNFMRQIGFDIGEKTNISGHAAAVYSEYKRAGKNVLDRGVQAEMHAKVRNLTWNMNFAGDMPYNQNFLGLLMTYMQVPHKAMLQATNRGLSRAERMRLVGADMVLWGTPTATAAYFLGSNILPENDYARELLTDGLQSLLLNYVMTGFSGMKTEVDFSSLAPYDMNGWRDIMKAVMFDGGMKALIDRAPAARVFGLGPDSRTGMAFKMSAGYFRDMMDEQAIDPVVFTDVLDSLGRMSSGWNNFQKARAMYMTGMVRDKVGKPIDEEVNGLEAFWQVLGFPPKSVAEYYDTMIKAAAEIKNFEDQGKKDAKEFMQVFMQKRNGMVNPEATIQMLSQYYASTSFIPGEENKKKYMAGLIGELQSSANNDVMEQLAKFLRFDDPASMADYVNESPLSREEKDRILQTLRDQSDYIKGMKK